MKKKVFALLSAVLMLTVLLSSLVFAVSTGVTRTLPRVNDEAGVIDSEEVEALNEKYDALSEKWQFDFAALTVNSTDGKDIIAFSDDYFDYNGFGIGDDNSGIVLVISFDPRECYISACGEGTNYFDYYECQNIIDEFYSELKSGDYAEVFDIFADEVEKYLDGTYSYVSDGYDDTYGDNFDSDDWYYSQNQGGWSSTIKREWHTLVLIPIGIGVALAILTVFLLTRGNKSVRMNNSASSYQVPGSFALRNAEDIFLHKTVSRTPHSDPDSNNNSGGGIGSSGTHIGSSGASHSGGGRGF